MFRGYAVFLSCTKCSANERGKGIPVDEERFLGNEYLAAE